MQSQRFWFQATKGILRVGITVAIAIGAFENSLHRGSWRNPTSYHAGYLTQLEAWGYSLADVERIIPDARKPKPRRPRKTTTAAPTADIGEVQTA